MSSNPAPTRSRANYGFALYLGCSTSFFLFLVWSLLPESERHLFGLTCLPQRYWAVAVPIHLLVTLALFGIFFYPALNLAMTPSPDDKCILEDKFSIRPPSPSSPVRPIPPPYDISVSDVSKRLYITSQ